MDTRSDTALPAGTVRLLDGGVGTELQKRGVPMTPQSWCGPVPPEHLTTLERIHRDYIAAGADVITANTYSTSRLLLDLDGIGSEFERINRAAVRTAMKARTRAGARAFWWPALSRIAVQSRKERLGRMQEVPPRRTGWPRPCASSAASCATRAAT